jgi:hypothetical protein
MRAARRFALAVGFTCLFALCFVTIAAAHTAGAGNTPAGLNRCSVMKPSAARGGKSSVKLRFYNDDGGGPANWKCKLITSKTKMYVAVGGFEGPQRYKRVTFSKFRKYAPSSACELISIKWKWARDSGGHRYRRITSIKVNKYVG